MAISRSETLAEAVGRFPASLTSSAKTSWSTASVCAALRALSRVKGPSRRGDMKTYTGVSASVEIDIFSRLF